MTDKEYEDNLRNLTAAYDKEVYALKCKYLSEKHPFKVGMDVSYRGGRGRIITLQINARIRSDVPPQLLLICHRINSNGQLNKLNKTDYVDADDATCI